MAKKMKKPKKAVRSVFKTNRKAKVGRGKPKGKPPAALRKKPKVQPRDVAPPDVDTDENEHE